MKLTSTEAVSWKRAFILPNLHLDFDACDIRNLERPFHRCTLMRRNLIAVLQSVVSSVYSEYAVRYCVFLFANHSTCEK